MFDSIRSDGEAVWAGRAGRTGIAEAHDPAQL